MIREFLKSFQLIILINIDINNIKYALHLLSYTFKKIYCYNFSRENLIDWSFYDDRTLINLIIRRNCTKQNKTKQDLDIVIRYSICILNVPW